MGGCRVRRSGHDFTVEGGFRNGVFSPYTGRYFVSLHQQLSLRERRAVPLEMLMVTIMENRRTLAFCIPYMFVLYGHVRSGGNRGPQLNLKEDRELRRPSTQGTSV